MRPDTKPKVTSITYITPGDRKLTVRWTAAERGQRGDASTASSGSTSAAAPARAATAGVPAPGLTKVLSGLVNNDAYNVRVQASNGAGWGPFGPQVKAQSFGKPTAVPAPTLTPRTPDAGRGRTPR